DATHQIHNLVNSAFITPIDEGDILLLASSLDDVVDLAEETGDKIDLYRIQSITDPARHMGDYLARAGVELAAALDRFEGYSERHRHVHLDPRAVSTGRRGAVRSLQSDRSRNHRRVLSSQGLEHHRQHAGDQARARGRDGCAARRDRMEPDHVVSRIA